MGDLERNAVERSFESQRLVLPFERYEALPRHAAYKYEYFAEAMHITPRPRFRHACIATDAVLDGVAADLVEAERDGLRLRAPEADDRTALSRGFAAAFANVPPFGPLGEERRQEAANAALAETFDGSEGPLVGAACSVVALSDGRPLGACLVTRARGERTVPKGMVDAPHLSWIFVPPLLARRGLARAMLARALEGSRAEGHPRLYSTFLVGNDASALWHWASGFELLPDPFSPRRGGTGR